MKADKLNNTVLVILLMILGVPLGLIVLENLGPSKVDARRAEAEARWFEERAATERWERELSRRKWMERETGKEMQRKFGWIDELKQEIDDRQKRINAENNLRLQQFSRQGGQN